MPAGWQRRPPTLDKSASNVKKTAPNFLKIGKIGSYRYSSRFLDEKVSRPMNAVTVTNRVYILALESQTRVSIKEVMYVDFSASRPGPAAKTPANGRPFWVPDYVQNGNWSLDPPCFWKSESVAMQDLETAGDTRFMYNPMSDFSLELIRWYRPDVFDVLFQKFCIRSKWTLSERQLALLNESVSPQAVDVDDFDANFSDESPAAATLKRASLTEDFQPTVDHYMALLSVRAFQLRHSMMHFR